jgi:hypothetical protein
MSLTPTENTEQVHLPKDNQAYGSLFAIVALFVAIAGILYTIFA